MDKKQNSLIANLEIDKLDILSGGFKPPIEDPLIDGALWNDANVLKISGTIPTEPGVRIRYTSTDDLTTLDAYAIGGTAHISDNGDGTYDLWSDDNCEFIALSDYYYDDAYQLNITKIEIIKGNTLKYFFYTDDMDIYASTIGNLPNVTEIIFNNNFDTSNVTNMNYMFSYCTSLTQLDVSSFDTSNVASMIGMFGNCDSLTQLDVSSFDTSNVTNMRGMFRYCASLTQLDVSSFDTSNVTHMIEMFEELILVEYIILPIISTDIEMLNMFYGCSSLICLNALNTTSSTNKTNIFKNCTALVQPDAAAQADLTDDDGANWVNPNACP